MAIKVNGTTVIDDSRNFTNIAGGFKTVNGTSVVGSGDISAGASTTYGAVGTYVMAYGSASNPGATVSGSSLRPSNAGTQNWGSGLSGTWRTMGYNRGPWTSGSEVTVYIRIS